MFRKYSNFNLATIRIWSWPVSISNLFTENALQNQLKFLENLIRKFLKNSQKSDWDDAGRAHISIRFFEFFKRYFKQVLGTSNFFETLVILFCFRIVSLYNSKRFSNFVEFLLISTVFSVKLQSISYQMFQTSNRFIKSLQVLLPFPSILHIFSE